MKRTSTVLRVGVFLLLAVFSLLTYNSRNLLSFIGAVLLHEGGHLASAKLVGVKLSAISFTPFGIIMEYRFNEVSPKKEIFVCLSGSIAGITVGIAILLCNVTNSAVTAFSLMSIALGALNLLPIKGLDGGNIAECLLSQICLPDRAYRYSRYLSIAAVIVFWIVTIRIEMRIGVNFSLLMLSVFFIYSQL